MDSTPPSPGPSEHPDAGSGSDFSVEQGRALHPSSESHPEHFRRCGRHWFDAALAGCDGCGAALCASCIVAVEAEEALCEACSMQRSATRRSLDASPPSWLRRRSQT